MRQALDSQKGLMTISPPAKVNVDNPSTQILASGIDSLNMAIDVFWSNTNPFDYLSDLKEAAKESRKDISGFFEIGEGKEKWHFNVKPHGSKGYEWMIDSKEFTFLIGSWKRPQSKPSILVEIRSEALWHLGVENAVEIIIQIILSQGGSKVILKPSRVDLCVDVLLPQKDWTFDLIQMATTRATKSAPFFTHRKLTGISLGSGKMLARLYDKPLEIRQKSKKTWMYDIWGIKEVPEGWRVIRVEFQLRRELLKELAINDIYNLFTHYDNIWAYCTKKWLKFQTNPGKHHTQRKTLPWWELVQSGFMGIQDSAPLIRSKALQFDIKQNTIQAIGHLRALIAARIAEFQLDEHVPAEIEDGLKPVLTMIKQSEESEAEFAKSVKEKVAKVQRTRLRHFAAETERRKYGFPKDNSEYVEPIKEKKPKTKRTRLRHFNTNTERRKRGFPKYNTQLK